MTDVNLMAERPTGAETIYVLKAGDSKRSWKLSWFKDTRTYLLECSEMQTDKLILAMPIDVADLVSLEILLETFKRGIQGFKVAHLNVPRDIAGKGVLGQ